MKGGFSIYKTISTAAPVLIGSGVAGFGAYYFRDSLFFGPDTSDVWLFVKSNETSDQASADLYEGESNTQLVSSASDDDGDDLKKKARNYHCQYNNLKANEESSKNCRIFSVTTSEKKWFLMNDVYIKKDEQNLVHEKGTLTNTVLEIPTNADKESLKTKDKYFFIQITAITYASLDFKSDSTIDILPIKQKSNESNKKFGTFKILFAKRQNTAYANTKYVLAKAEELKNITAANIQSDNNTPVESITITQPESNSTYLCSFDEDKTETDDLKPCVIYNFQTSAETDGFFFSQQGSETLTKSTTINRNYWYLIELNEPKHSYDIKNMKLELVNKVTSGSETNKKVIKFTSPIAVSISEIDSNKKVPFILSFK